MDDFLDLRGRNRKRNNANAIDFALGIGVTKRPVTKKSPGRSTLDSRSSSGFNSWL